MDFGVILKDFFQIVYSWVMILQLLAVSFSVVYAMIPAKRNLEGWMRIIVETAVLFICETFFNLVFFILSHYVSFLAGVNFPLAHLVAITVYVRFFCKYHRPARFIMGATLFITAIDIAELGSRAGNYFSAVFGEGFYDWLCIVADIFIVVMAVIIRRYSIHKFVDIPRKSVGFVLISALLSGTFILVSIRRTLSFEFFTEASPAVTTLKGILCLALLLIYAAVFITYLIVFFHSKEYAERVTAEVENSLLKANANMIAVSNQAMEEVREIRHDIANQYAVIRVLLREQKYKELEDYFSTMNIEFEDVIRFIDCKNSILNSIINMEILKAQSYKTRIVSIINVPPELPIDNNDICRILFNLIDNAVEATSRQPEQEDRIVDLNISVKNDYLYIYVQNRFDGEGKDVKELLKLNTVKEDYRNHGYGHKIVRRIVNKYNGEIRYLVEDGEFIVEVMLDIKAKKEK